MSQSRAAVAWVGLAIAALTVAYGPFLLEHGRNGADPRVFHDDARQFVAPFLVQDDAAAYYLTFLPIGYRVLYRAASRVVDPVAVSKALPYVLLAGVLFGMAAAAGHLGGPAAAVAAAALVLSTDVFLDPMGGGTPRAFCFPLLALAAAALAAGRPVALAALTVAAAAFYPVAAVVIGLALAALALWPTPGLMPDPPRWTRPRDLTLLALTVLAVLLLQVPALAERGYGRMLGPGDVTTYPEAGPGGRWIDTDRAPAECAVFSAFLTRSRPVAVSALTGGGPAWSDPLRRWARARAGRVEAAFVVVTLVGLAVLAWRDRSARRLLLLPLVAAVGHDVSCVAAPYLYLADRYVTFSVPILIVIGLPVAGGTLAALAARPAARWWARPAGALGVSAVCLLLLGGRGDPTAGFTEVVRTPRLYAFVASLPSGALVAGWPAETIDDVPYLSRRRAFLTGETHQAFHQGWVDEMRRRMRVLVDALLAADPEPLRRLRDEWGVTHLIVDGRHYVGQPPIYFKPFDAWIQDGLARGRVAGFEVPRQVPRATVFAEGPIAVLELSRLTPAD